MIHSIAYRRMCSVLETLTECSIQLVAAQRLDVLTAYYVSSCCKSSGSVFGTQRMKAESLYFYWINSLIFFFFFKCYFCLEMMYKEQVSYFII